MRLTYSSVSLCVLVSNFIICIYYVMQRYMIQFHKVHPKYFMICIGLIILRCIFPFELLYSKTIASETVLPILQNLGLTYIGTGIQLYYFVLLIWSIVSVIQLLMVLWNQQSFNKTIKKLPNSKYMPLLRNILRMQNVSAHIDLIEVPGIASPMIVGFIRPRILISNDLSEEDLYYALLHEVAHYKNHHLLFIACIQMLNIIYWWNPMIHFFKRIALQMIELQADSSVAEMLSEEERLNYLKSILNIAQKYNDKNHLKTVGLGFQEDSSALYKRFNNILRNEEKPIEKFFPCLFLLLLLLSTSFVVEPSSANPEDIQGTFHLQKDCYFLYDNGLYKLYENDEYLFTIDSINTFTNIPVYNIGED